MNRQVGFVSASLHKSLGGAGTLNQVQRRRKQALEAMLEDSAVTR